MSPSSVLLVTILPDDELPAVLAAFDLDPAVQPVPLGDWLSYRATVQSSRRPDSALDVLIVCLVKAGVVVTELSVARLFHTPKPDLALLVGCACGRDDTTKLCDVVVSAGGVYYYGPVGGDGNPRPELKQPDRSLTNWVEVQLTQAKLKKYGWLESMQAAFQTLKKHEPKAELPETLDPSVHFRKIASSEKIVTSADVKKLAKADGTIYAGEKEGFGFANVCDTEPGLQKRWLVIRGVSDFGDKQQREQWKLGATVTAASFARCLIQQFDDFLFNVVASERTANRISPSAGTDNRLPQHSLFSRKPIPDLMRIASRDDGLDLSSVRFTRELTISQLERICSGTNSKKILRDARARAYGAKYGKRAQTEDERYTLVGFENWQREFIQVLKQAIAPCEMSGLDVLDVGIGTGTELRELVGQVRSLIVVDIAQAALQTAKSLLKLESANAKCCAGEDLKGIRNGSIDLYISLRTFQSTLFDRERALAEARRVLRPGGRVLLSIPTKFHDLMTNKVTEGLLVSPEMVDVSADLPFQEADQLRRLLAASQFTGFGFCTGAVEIYAWAAR